MRAALGLAVVLSTLAGTRLQAGGGGEAGAAARGAAARGAAAHQATALQLAGAARELWLQLGSGEPHEPRWRRRAAAAVVLQPQPQPEPEPEP